jgi:hypothetical protein
MLTGLKAQDRVVPLKNWATPLYWQPNQAERGAAAPQIVFSANQVSPNALTFVAITPCRLVDTRGSGVGFIGDSPFSGPSLTPGFTQTFLVQSATEADTSAPAPCGTIPSIAQAYSFNVTVVPHGGGAVDYISIWPDGGTQPRVSTLDDVQGQVVANAAIVPAGSPSGGVKVYNSGPATTDVIIDMNGFFTAPTDLLNNTAIGAGTLTDNTSGINNTATGSDALTSNQSGGDNTASGVNALKANMSGSFNTATGFNALENNVNGGNNTATGNSALLSNSGGNNNTATGEEALFKNIGGNDNTAVGGLALQANTAGSYNTATGYGALQNNTVSGNAAFGYQALGANVNGTGNTAVGTNALYVSVGSSNTAFGYAALGANVNGTANTAVGISALGSDLGSNNIAIGAGAGANVGLPGATAGTGNDNIYIGNAGGLSDNGVIAIGVQGTQGATYIAGIYGATSSSGVEVYVNSNGQLGTVLSSGRFKEDITDMGDSSSKLLQLRPVSFFYKPEYDDGTHLPQYGLIAEEVAKVYPEMVAYGNDGHILTVKYQLLAPMLLNEVQKQDRELRAQAEAIQLQQEQNRKLEDRLRALETLSGQPSNAGGIR